MNRRSEKRKLLVWCSLESICGSFAVHSLHGWHIWVSWPRIEGGSCCSLDNSAIVWKPTRVCIEWWIVYNRRGLNGGMTWCRFITRPGPVAFTSLLVPRQPKPELERCEFMMIETSLLCVCTCATKRVLQQALKQESSIKKCQMCREWVYKVANRQMDSQSNYISTRKLRIWHFYWRATGYLYCSLYWEAEDLEGDVKMSIFC